MKKVILLFFLLVFNSCTRNFYDIEELKYSKGDLIPLNDSTKNLYYNDAAFIEFDQVIEDTINRYEQVELKEQNILSHYADLLNIYNNSYSISNSFFEHITSIHTYGASALYQIYVSVDTSKIWSGQWKNGYNYTGINKIDTLIAKYDLEIVFLFESTHGYYSFQLTSKVPINYFALIEKFQKTNEFRYVEPEVLIGGGSHISIVAKDNHKLYRFALGWGDCPSGCIHYHYWVTKVNNQEILLLEESGDPLTQ